MKRRCWLLALVVLLVPVVVLAQPAKKDAKADAKPEAADGQQPGDQVPDGTQPNDQPPEKKNRPYQTSVFDMENMSDIEIEQYGKIAKIREESIKKLKDLVESAPNHPQIADLYYRIAEYQTQNIIYSVALQAKDYRKAMADYNAGIIKEEPKPPVKDYSETLPYYEKILVEHKDYPKYEEVLFYLGRNGLETGRSKNDANLSATSIKYLDLLGEKYPDSKFLPNAWLMCGEYFFDENNLSEALKYYERIVSNYKTHDAYLYALYKQGWVYYNYQQYDKTLAAFEEVIKGLREKGKADDTLRTMTIRDYVITTSEAGLGWTRARDFLIAEVGTEAAHELLYQMADLMATNSFNQDAIDIYRYFVGLDPVSPKAVQYWNEILEVYRYNFPFAETEAQVAALNEFFRSDSAWAQKNAGNAEATAFAQDLIVKWELSLAEFYIEEGLYFNKGDQAFVTAVGRFQAVLKEGALKREEQAWAGILVSYLGLMRSESKGKLIFVAENVLGLTYPDDYRMPRKPVVAPLTNTEQAYMDALDKYLALPKHEGQKPALKPYAQVDMMAQALYTGALIYYMRGKFDQALVLIDKLIAYNPKSEYLGHAAEIAFQCSSRVEDWTGLQRRMKAMIDVGNFAVTDQVRLTDFLCHGMTREAVALSNNKAYADALSKFSLTVTACKENTERAAEALYEMGIAAEKAGFIDQAKTAYDRVLKEYPTSKVKGMAKRKYDAIKNK